MSVHGGGQHWWEKILWQFTVAIKSDPVAPVLSASALKIKKHCMTENEISAEILDAAIAVHNSIGGPGNKKIKDGWTRVANGL